MKTDPAETRPFYRLLGFRAQSVEKPGFSRLLLDDREELRNSRGDIHGGVVAALLDAAMGNALRSALKDGEGSATVSLTVNYLRPARGKLIALGRVVRAGRSIASVDAQIEDSTGLVVAHAIGTLRVIANRSEA